MKYVDYSSLFTGPPAQLVVMSTYGFDPDFFERRILRASSLAKARRIMVLVDGRQWRQMASDESIARWLNRKYLVVPIDVADGVFHPKLHLLVYETDAKLICGSCNLTRSGCTHNLEIVNIMSSVGENSEGEAPSAVFEQAYRFYESALQHGSGRASDVARGWLKDVEASLPWKTADSYDARPILLHTLDGPLWPRLVDAIGPDSPQRIVVLSPFYDTNGGLIARLRKRWPSSRIEIIAQQKTCNVPTRSVKALSPPPRLFEVLSGSRRLHAKLVAWQRGNQWQGAMVGSANFTTAAHDGHNVEACLLLPTGMVDIDSMFDRQLGCREVAIDQFESARAEEPQPVPVETLTVQLRSAILRNNQQLELDYKLSLDMTPQSVALALRAGGELLPRCTARLSRRAPKGPTTVQLPQAATADVHGTLMASIIVKFERHQVESAATWVIQEQRLTHEPEHSSTTQTKSQIQETGEGLTKFLDELGARDGIASAVEFLNHFNIRFIDGGGKSGRGRFKLRRSDPFKQDVLPDWWNQIDPSAKDLAGAIYAFCDRHEKNRLCRHAARGNINGIENFLDIFVAVVQLLYTFMRRQRESGYSIVTPAQFIGRGCRLLEIATDGIKAKENACPGYLSTLHTNLDGNLQLLRERCHEVNFTGHITAALVAAQVGRCVLDGMSFSDAVNMKPRRNLPAQAKRVNACYRQVGLEPPSKDRVMDALANFQMMSDEELALYRQVS